MTQVLYRSQPLVLFLEPQPDLSAAVARELASRAVHASASGLSAPANLLPGTACSAVCESVSTGQQVLRRVSSPEVIGLVLDLRAVAREALSLLRQLLACSQRPEVLAVGDAQHLELLPLLLEAGCGAVVTQLPWDLPVADWIQRLPVSVNSCSGPVHASHL